MTGYEIISLFKTLFSKDVAATNQPVSSFIILKNVNTYRNDRLRQMNVSIKHLYNSCLQSFYCRRAGYLETEGLRGIFPVPKVFYDAFGRPLVNIYANGCAYRLVGDKGSAYKYFGTKYSKIADKVFYYDSGDNSIILNNGNAEVIEVVGVFEDPISVPGFSLYDEYPCPVEYITTLRDWAVKYKKPVPPEEVGRTDPQAS